jgi:hypothetical protein
MKTELDEKFRGGIYSYKIFMYSTSKFNNKQETSFLHFFMSMFNDSFCLSYSDYTWASQKVSAMIYFKACVGCAAYFACR